MEHILTNQLRAAKAAGRVLSRVSGDVRAALVENIAGAVDAAKISILAANSIDVNAAKAAGMSVTLIDRLRLTDAKLDGMVSDIRAVSMLPDPIGKSTSIGVQASGLTVNRVSIPLGVVGVIYESRPNVTTDISALCIRSGNAVVLRGGSETLNTNRALVAAIRSALGEFREAVQFVDDPSRERVRDLICADRYVDVIIPRGGAALGRLCSEEGTVPVIIGGAGVCHLYLDQSAKPKGALEVILNAKTQRTSVCNALDTLLIHRNVMDGLGIAIAAVLSVDGVCLHVDDTAAVLLERHGLPYVRVTEEDLATEWLGMHLNLLVVDGLPEAISHILQYGSHSDGILTEDPETAETFIREVDSPAVFVNASTRFHDGGQFGLGAEVAVSTQKVHARGPLGLEALTSYKWIASGDYLVRN